MPYQETMNSQVTKLVDEKTKKRLQARAQKEHQEESHNRSNRRIRGKKATD